MDSVTMNEVGRNKGIYGDRCPRCWVESRDQNQMRVVHRTDTHDYAAPSGHNGNNKLCVEWCPFCGTVRHTVVISTDESIYLYTMGEEGSNEAG